MKKMLSIFLCTLLFISASGCKSQNEINQESSCEVLTEGFSLVTLPLPNEVTMSTVQYCEKNLMYIGGFTQTGAPIFGKLVDESFFEYEIPDDTEYIYAGCGSEMGTMVLVGTYPQFWSDVNGNAHINENKEKKMSIIVYSNEGSINSEIPISDTRVLNQNIKSLCYYKDNYYLLATHCFIQLDVNGNVNNIIQKDNSTFISQNLSEKGLAVCAFYAEADGGDNTTKIQLLDTEHFQFSDIYSDSERIIYGFGYAEGSGYLINADGILFTLEQDGNLEEQFSFSKLGSARFDYREIYQYRGEYIAVVKNQDSIKKISYGELTDDRRKLRLLATVNSPAIVNLVERFNQSNSDYVVTIEYVGDMSQEQLNTMIISGKGPDIYAMIGMDMFKNVKHDIAFENVYPYLVSDETYGPESLLPAILNASLENGALYIIPLDFMIWTFCAQKDLFPQTEATLKEILDSNAGYNSPIFSAVMARDDLWYWLSNLYINNYLDEQTNTINFKTKEFELLLERCAEVDEQQSPFDDSGLIHLEQIPGVLRLNYLHEKYGNSYTLNTAIGSAFSIQQSVAISSQSENKEGAWLFVREILSPNFPKSSDLCLPATQERFDALITQGINGELWNLNEAIQITSYEEQELKNLLDNTYILLEEYPTVIQIMREEAEKFFAGDKTAEQTADIIQSRVNLVMAEKYR